jgi:hypothetical protein
MWSQTKGERMSTTEAFTYEEEFGPDERYQIWERPRYVGHLEEGRAHASEPRLIATCPSAEAVGVALVQLAEDRAEAGTYHAPIIGVLDSENGRWVTGMWPGGGAL